MNDNLKLKNFPKIYYINLDRHITRNEQMLSILANLKHQRISGVDGNLFLDDKDYIKKTYNMNVYEMGCTMSHLKAINTYLNDTSNNDAWAIISEDDISFEFVEYWDLNFEDYIKKLPSDWEIFQIMSLHFKDVNQEKLFKIEKKFYYSTGFYLIKREAAKKIVDTYFSEKYIKEKTNCYLADTLIYKDAKTYTIYPSLIMSRGGETSISDTKSKIYQKLRNQEQSYLSQKKMWIENLK